MSECFECGRPAEEDHHVIPRSMGGTKTVPLCGDCHALLHMGKKRRDTTSALTKAALQKLKAAGAKLGNRTNLAYASAKGAASTSARAREFRDKTMPLIIQNREQGKTQMEIAEEFNRLGVKTANGGKWTQALLSRLLKPST